MLTRCLCALLFALPAVAQDVEAKVAELLRSKDDADPKLVQAIAETRDRRGAEGLTKAFDAVGSLYMKREILRGLASFAGVPEAEQPAMQKLANIAGAEEEAELRSAAIAALGQSPKIGKHFLKQLVDGEASDLVREPALREHVKLAEAEDAAWYRHIWNLKQEQRKDKDGNIQGAELNAIRQIAFQGLLPQLGEEDLVETLRREIDPKIRRKALDEMRKRNLGKTVEMAEWLLSRVDFPGKDRAEAARILIDKQGSKAVNTFLDLAKKRDVTPEDLRNEMAALIANLDDDATNKRMVKLLGKGKPHEKVFAIQATTKIADPKVVATVRKGLADSELEVRRAAAKSLATRGDRESLPELRNLLQKPKNPGDQRLAIEAISEIERNASSWRKELAIFVGDKDRDVRNTAIEQLGNARDKQQLPVLLSALEHADWSTRFCAVEAVAGFRDKQVVPKLIERIGKEQGRLSKRIADALWNLTAQPFEEDAAKWGAWWAEAAAAFEVVSEKDLDKAAQARELRRLQARTRASAKFFGIKVESHRVIFVIDVSGSMLESMYGRYVGKRGAARIDVAKLELSQAIKNLDEGALFNVFAFSSSVARWQKEGIGTNSAQSREAALTWVDRLGAQGATNLYDSMKQAFDDQDVDTIFVMSDGEPTNGEVIDPHRIREDVAFWNKHRKVKIHTISIGGNLEVLEWLATDSGGKYVQMR